MRQRGKQIRDGNTLVSFEEAEFDDVLYAIALSLHDQPGITG